MFPTVRCHIPLSPVKNPPPPAMRPFVKILRPLVKSIKVQVRLVVNCMKYKFVY